MKLPKLLLGAILLGITVQTNSSCNKKEKETAPATTNEQTNPPAAPPDNCPACGMG